MGKQTYFIAMDADERMILQRAFDLGASLVGEWQREGQPVICSALQQYDPSNYRRTCYFWIPSVSDLHWSAVSGALDQDESEAIEFFRTTQTSEGLLVSGRVYLPSAKLIYVDGAPAWASYHEKVLELFEQLRKFLKKSFVLYKSDLGSVYIGPAALDFHRRGGRLKVSGSPKDVVVPGP